MIFWLVPIAGWLLLAAMVRFLPAVEGDPEFTYGDAALYLAGCAFLLFGVSAYARYAV